MTKQINTQNSINELILKHGDVDKDFQKAIKEAYVKGLTEGKDVGIRVDDINHYCYGNRREELRYEILLEEDIKSEIDSEVNKWKEHNKILKDKLDSSKEWKQKSLYKRIFKQD